MTQLLRTNHTQEQAEVMMPVTAFTADTSSVQILLTTCSLPIKDHLNTIHALVNSSGSVVESYTFDAWGRVLSIKNGSGTTITKSAIGNRYLWQGREYSYSTGLYYFRARWYEPITGRWLSNDPIGISGGLNQYVFCSNNPINFRDPSGLCEDYHWWSDKDVWKAMGWGMSEGAAAALDAINPFGDPLKIAYTDEYGMNLDGTEWSYAFGQFSRGYLMTAVIPNFGAWAKNPILYEVGCKALPNCLWKMGGFEAMTVAQRGAVLSEMFGGSWKAYTYLFTRCVPYWKLFFTTGLTPAGGVSSVAGYQAYDSFRK